VYELGNLGVQGFSYTSDTVTEARKQGRKIQIEIAECEWPIVCVDPEHLTGKEWKFIVDTAAFRENLVLACIDEVHLIDEWGEEFRPSFKRVGPFFRGSLPSSTSILALSATLQPGKDTESICSSLGFTLGAFYHERRSNERPNIQFIFEKLSHGLRSSEFPDILRYLSGNRKTILYCATIDMCFRVAVFLWRLLPPGPAKLKRVRLYHAMCWPDENDETTRLLRDDPECQIVIATIAFGQGFNVKPALDSIQLGVAVSVNQIEQQRGRVGRDLSQHARGVIFVQASAITAAEKYLKGTLAFVY